MLQRIEKTSVTRKVNTSKRDIALAKRFNELYSQERIRIDDVITRLAEEFYVSESVVKRSLKRH